MSTLTLDSLTTVLIDGRKRFESTLEKLIFQTNMAELSTKIFSLSVAFGVEFHFYETTTLVSEVLYIVCPKQ